MTVLLVGENAAEREALGWVLEAFQHRVEHAPSALHAVDALARSWPDALVLADSAEESTRQAIQARFGNLPPTVSTAGIARPLTMERLDEAVRRAIRGL